MNGSLERIVRGNKECEETIKKSKRRIFEKTVSNLPTSSYGNRNAANEPKRMRS